MLKKYEAEEYLDKLHSKALDYTLNMHSKALSLF